MNIHLDVINPGLSRCEPDSPMRPDWYQGQTGCSQDTSSDGFIHLDHDWIPSVISEGDSTWFCRRCRRVERFTVTEEKES